MTRRALVEELARVLKMPRKRAAPILEVILDSMVCALGRGERVEIRGFGSFSPRPRGGWIGRDPRSGARIEVLPHRVAHFKAGRELKDRVNGGAQETILG